MEIKTVEYRALSLVGMSIIVKPGSTQIPPLWGKVFGRMHEIPGLVANSVSYGVSSGMNEDGTFTYTAAFEATGEPPEGMVKLEYPAATYAVFDCTLATIPKVYGQIYSEWLPNSEWQPTADYNFELYGATFDPNHPDAVFQVYAPVIHKG